MMRDPSLKEKQDDERGQKRSRRDSGITEGTGGGEAGTPRRQRAQEEAHRENPTGGAPEQRSGGQNPGHTPRSNKSIGKRKAAQTTGPRGESSQQPRSGEKRPSMVRNDGRVTSKQRIQIGPTTVNRIVGGRYEVADGAWGVGKRKRGDTGDTDHRERRRRARTEESN